MCVLGEDEGGEGRRRMRREEDDTEKDEREGKEKVGTKREWEENRAKINRWKRKGK